MAAILSLINTHTPSKLILRETLSKIQVSIIDILSLRRGKGIVCVY